MTDTFSYPPPYNARSVAPSFFHNEPVRVSGPSLVARRDLIYTLDPSDRIGEIDPPGLGFRLTFRKVAGNRRDHIPLLGRHVDANTRVQDLVARLILWRDLFQDHRRSIEHSQFEIATRRKDMPLPIGLQGIGDLGGRRKTPLWLPRLPAERRRPVTANIMSD
jgi:hypothetical protein